MRVTSKQTVLGVQAVVEACTDLFAFVGTAENAGEPGNGRCVRLHCDGLNLIHVLIVEEKEQPVLEDRTTQIETRIAACEEWIEGKAIAGKSGIRSNIVIAEE